MLTMLPAMLPARLCMARLPARLAPAVMCDRLRLVAVEAVKPQRLVCRAVIVPETGGGMPIGNGGECGSPGP